MEYDNAAIRTYVGNFYPASTIEIKGEDISVHPSDAVAPIYLSRSGVIRAIENSRRTREQRLSLERQTLF